MCLKENHSDLPSNEYSRLYSAESEYLRRQDMNSKSGEEQKKGHHVRRSPNFDSNSDKEPKKKGQNDDVLILGRVCSAGRVLGLDSAHLYLLGRVLGLDSAHRPSYSDSTRPITRTRLGRLLELDSAHLYLRIFLNLAWLDT